MTAKKAMYPAVRWSAKDCRWRGQVHVAGESIWSSPVTRDRYSAALRDARGWITRNSC